MEPKEPSSQPSSAPTDSEVPAVRTRSGRVSKPPVRYEPVEVVEDDYAPEDYDSQESSDIDSSVEYDESEIDDDDDADDDGNLDGFVVADKSESDSDDNDGPSTPLPVKKRPVKPARK